jgi:hypothetical protein
VESARWSYGAQMITSDSCTGMRILRGQVLGSSEYHVYIMLSQSDALRFEEVFTKFSGKEFSNRIAVEDIEDALGEMKVKLSAEGAQYCDCDFENVRCALILSYIRIEKLFGCSRF